MGILDTISYNGISTHDDSRIYDYDEEEMRDRLPNRMVNYVKGAILRFKLRLGIIDPNKLERSLR